MNVLFVCTGNTCRSAMAEYLLKKALASENSLSHVQVFSAGVAASPGQGASTGAKRALEKRGLNGENHRSQVFSMELAKDAHLILTMTRTHKNVILDQFPGLSDRIFTLTEYVRQEYEDITDPFGGNEEMFDSCVNQLEELIAELVEQIKKE